MQIFVHIHIYLLCKDHFGIPTTLKIPEPKFQHQNYVFCYVSCLWRVDCVLCLSLLIFICRALEF